MIDRRLRPASTLPGLAALVIATAAGATADDAARRPVAELPAVGRLPDPFTFADGSAVRVPADWDRRRAELKALFEEHEYGHLPPKPESMKVQVSLPAGEDEDGPHREAWDVALRRGEKSLTLHLRADWPAGGAGPFPAVVRLVSSKPGGPDRPDDSRKYLDRGYALVQFDCMEVAPDDQAKARSTGVYTLFGDGIDAGCIMAWAWGFHRVVDALLTEPRVDPTRIVVTGHSRFGKASLVAGAFDERVALTAPSHSGAGGTGLFRFAPPEAESLAVIAERFPHWFRPDFARFAGHVDRLPVDQHELRALVAPRGFLSTEGTNDLWANPAGSQLADRAAGRVYAFLGAPDRLAVRFRPIGHDVTSEDVVAFADFLFRGKPLPDGFRARPYPEAEDAFTWDAPAGPGR